MRNCFNIAVLPAAGHLAIGETSELKAMHPGVIAATDSLIYCEKLADHRNTAENHVHTASLSTESLVTKYLATVRILLRSAKHEPIDTFPRLEIAGAG